MTPTRRTESRSARSTNRRARSIEERIEVCVEVRVEVGVGGACRSVSARQHVTDELAMRRNTIAKPSYRWNSLIIRNCLRRRILHKHNQHPPCSVLDTARYHIIPSKQIHNEYRPCAINIVSVKSIFSLRNEREIRLH